ncbi:MAG TPA: DUF87 domain-containing protein [Abditibacteriaceae bacterium]|jgi:hypothetical protein
MKPPILKFDGESNEANAVLDLDRLIVSRLLIQANSGAGKSLALRALLEGTHGRIPQIIFDPEGEFASLRERFPYILAGKEGDVPTTVATAPLLCRRLLEVGTSCVIDLYELTMPDRRKYVRAFLEELMALPRELWKPLLVVIDEAHIFMPERGSGEAESTEAVIRLATQGRKRGFCLVAATQRLSKVHKDGAAELLNKMIGRTSLDVDIKRAADELGFGKEKSAELKKLQPGQFYAYGPAISQEVALIQTGEVLTSHPDSSKSGAYTPPPPPTAIKELLAQFADLPEQAEEQGRSIEELRATVAELRAELKKQPEPKTEIVQVPVVEPERVEQLKNLVNDMQGLIKDVASISAVLVSQLERVSSASELPTTLSAGAGPPMAPAFIVTSHPQGGGTPALPPNAPNTPPASKAKKTNPIAAQIREEISPRQQRMLNILADFAAIGAIMVERENLAVLSGQSPKSSAYDANLRSLKRDALIAAFGGPSGQSVRLTDKGRDVAIASNSIQSLGNLHAAWFLALSKWPRQVVMLKVLIEVYPHALGYAQFAERTGQSVTSSAYDSHLRALRDWGLIEWRGKEPVRATALLFPEQLK